MEQRGARGRAPRRWAFLVHTLAKVGPPVYLAHLLGWIAAHDDVTLDVVTMEDGPVGDRLRPLATVTVVPDPTAPGAARALAGLVDLDLVCVHTTATAALLDALPAPGTPVVTHAHEMAVGLDYHLPDRARALALARTDHWVAASAAVAGALGTTLGLDPRAVEVHHEMVAPLDPPPGARDRLRADLGLAPSAEVVGCVAVLSWRKGPDLFLSLARDLRARAPGRDLHLVWVGGAADHPEVRAFLAERDAAGLTDVVHHVAAVDDATDAMAGFDLFALTAREDAYPLACLEAASLGVPLVCFDAGGMGEFVEGDAGVVVGYPDVGALAGAVLDLLDRPEARAAAGRTGADRVRRRHVPDVAAPLLHASLTRWEARR